MPQYIFIVAYDGTRFHGFQRQHSNDATEARSKKGKLNNNSNGDFTVVEGMKKRVRVDMETGERLHMTLATMNYRTVTVQECIECAILQWLSMVMIAVPDTSTSTDARNTATATATTTKRTWSLEKLNLRAAGRTDKGVHARGQVVAVQLPGPDQLKPGTLSCFWKIQKAIHGRLPVDISIRRVLLPVPKIVSNPIASEPSSSTSSTTTTVLFDPQRDAKLKRYTYAIKYQRLPLPARPATSTNDTTAPTMTEAVGSQMFRTALDDSPCLWLCQHPLDDSILSKICQQLKGEHNYSAFVHKAARAEKDNTLTVSRFDFEIVQDHEVPPSLFLDPHINGNNIDEEKAPILVLGRFIVEGQGFRRQMVRNLVGFVVDVARGKETFETDSLWTGSTEAAARVHSAPSTGLCLEFVKY